VEKLKKYSKNVSNLEEVDRESFIRKCFVFQQGENNYKHYLQNDYEGMDFSFKLPLDGNGTTDLLNMVKDFILYQNINYSQDVYQGIYDSINTNKQIATHESTNAQFLTYSYHSLYETLSDLGCIKTSQDLTYVFRLEMKDGKGLYTSAYSDDYITKSNDAAILEYDQRKVPKRDNGLSTLFLAYDSRHLITNRYADNYNFSFSSK
jgi:hypothetical protein